MRHRRASRAALCRAAILVGFVAGFAPLALHGQERTPVAESAPAPKFVTVCADAGAGGYEAFPDVCRTKTGELICVFYAGYGHVSDPNEKLPRERESPCAAAATTDGPGRRPKRWSTRPSTIATCRSSPCPTANCS